MLGVLAGWMPASTSTKLEARSLAISKSKSSRSILVWPAVGVPADRRQQILGYRNANHTRPISKAARPEPASISTGLCGCTNNPVPCPNQKSPTAINNGPTTTRTIFMSACLDRAFAIAS